MSKSLYTTYIETIAPTTETIGVVGQLYLDTSTKTLYQCVEVDTTTPSYTWKEVGGGVSQENFDKLVNNETQIVKRDSTYRFFAGGSQETNNTQAIGIGYKAKPGSYSVAIGGQSYNNTTETGYYSVSIGMGSNAVATRSVQLGQGINNKEKSLQILDDNIYDASTHTITVQNIELNGEDLAEKLENAGGTNVVSVEEDTITTNKLEKVVHLSEEQYQELITNGSITIGEQTLNYDENTIYVTNDNNGALKELELSGDSVLTSTQTFYKHIQIMVEFETDSIHAGFDCVLHPYDEAVCFVTYDVLVNGQANFGTAYLDESGHVVVNVPSGLTFSNIHAKYCELSAHSGGSAESGVAEKKYLHRIRIYQQNTVEICVHLINNSNTKLNSMGALATYLYNDGSQIDNTMATGAVHTPNYLGVVSSIYATGKYDLVVRMLETANNQTVVYNLTNGPIYSDTVQEL